MALALAHETIQDSPSTVFSQITAFALANNRAS